LRQNNLLAVGKKQLAKAVGSWQKQLAVGKKKLAKRSWQKQLAKRLKTTFSGISS
jgi:hypothetical protein